MPNNNRLTNEICRLCSMKYKVKLINNDQQHLQVLIEGPKETPYEGGKFLVNINIPDDYPYKSPNIGFETKIFHPNIDEQSGSVCLDVLNQVWTPLFDLLNVVEHFLPQLLAYPNSLDPLNSEAAQLWVHDKEKFNCNVRKYINLYCVDNKELELENSDVIDSTELEL